MKKDNILKIRYYDIVAALFALAVFSFFFVRVAYGINRTDESFYLAVAQRFANGDRPLVDEWHISQISDLFLVPFYAVFKLVTSSNDGIILFMRRVFVAVNFAFFWIVYRKLRPYRIWGFFAAAVISAYVPWAMFTLNYYTMIPRLLTLICIVLFFGKEKTTTFRLAAAGVLLSAAVLVEPPLILLYLLFSLVTLIVSIRKKKTGSAGNYDFILNRRCWSTITVTAMVCAVLFIVFLSLKSGLKNIFVSIPEILSDSEYDFSFGGNVQSFLASKIPHIADVFGSVNLLLSVLLCVIVFIFDKKASSIKGKLFLFLLSNLLVLSFCLYPIILGLSVESGGIYDWRYYVVTPIPLYVFGFVNYTLCKTKDRRLFCVWLIGLIASLITDSFSDVSISICAVLAAIPGFLSFGALWDEFTAFCTTFETKTNKARQNIRLGSGLVYSMRDMKRDRVFFRLSAVFFSLFIAWECANIYFEGTFLYDFDDNAAARLERISEGSYKGIYTTPDNMRSYNELMSDIQMIQKMSDGPVYLDFPHPIALLELDLPLSNCSCWNSEGDRDRQLRYFKLHPEKAPDVIYCFKNERLVGSESLETQSALFKEYAGMLCDGTIIQGKAGLVVDVQKWNGPDDPKIMSWVLQHQKEF